jgi:MFS family permease
MTLQGIVKDFGGLVATRTLLGVFEAGFFPASTFLLGEWYCRFEVQWRLSIFFSAASLAGAFSGLLAFALDKMDGLGNLAGWRWIFVIEGIVTVVVGATVPWSLPDSPATASFLTPDQKELVISRLERDAGPEARGADTGGKLQWQSVKSAMMDWRIWFTIFIYWGNT